MKSLVERFKNRCEQAEEESNLKLDNWNDQVLGAVKKKKKEK